jgi:hypothetical protein
MRKLISTALALVVHFAVCTNLANAEPVINAEFDVVNVYVGTVNLYGTNNLLISTGNLMTVETENSLSDPSTAQLILSFQGPSVAASVAADATMFQYVRDKIGTFVSSNGLGLADDVFNPTHPALAQLNELVAGHPTSITITSQSALVPFGTTNEFAYFWGPFVAGSNLMEGTTVVNVSQETINEQVAAVPEPSTWAMMVLGFAGLGVMAYRRKALIAV